MKIEKCPFCGGAAEATQEDNYGFRDDEWEVWCGTCGLLFGFAKQYSKDEAIAAWNRRADHIRDTTKKVSNADRLRRRNIVRLIDEIAYQEKIAKIPIEERTFVKAWETAQDMPTIDAVPVVRGEWVEAKSGVMSVWPPGQVMCSVCGQRMPSQWKKMPPYCYGCGAKMK